jgi:hypothetical protein
LKTFKPGDLVKIRTDLHFTNDGLSVTGGEYTKNVLRLYQMIDLTSYPSCNDFFGSTTDIPMNTAGHIMNYLGRPSSISDLARNNVYDVYEILVLGEVRQIFSCNLIDVTEEKQKNEFSP